MTEEKPKKTGGKKGAAKAAASLRPTAQQVDKLATVMEAVTGCVPASLQTAQMAAASSTDLFDYFATNSGRLIFKWLHYFDIYERHFASFRNRDITFLEIGVFHGGSLQMWKQFFGPKARIIGIDINPICKTYEEEGISIEIGSQEDRAFLKYLSEKYGPFDIVLDDGGHTMSQQIISFEELYPQVRRDGIYVCEDLHTSYWRDWGGGYRQPFTFIEYAKGLIDQLHAWHSKDQESFCVTPFTQTAFGMHFYDSMLVIEKRMITPPVSRATGSPSF